MNLAARIAMALKDAMKSRDQSRVTALRFILAMIKNKQIAKRAELTDQEIEPLLRGEVKKRQAAAAIFAAAKREDLAQKETGEVQIIQEFLPKLTI